MDINQNIQNLNYNPRGIMFLKILSYTSRLLCICKIDLFVFILIIVMHVFLNKYQVDIMMLQNRDNNLHQTTIKVVHRQNFHQTNLSSQI